MEKRQTLEMVDGGAADAGDDGRGIEAVPEYGWGMDSSSSRDLWLLYVERPYCHGDAVYNQLKSSLLFPSILTKANDRRKKITEEANNLLVTHPKTCVTLPLTLPQTQINPPTPYHTHCPHTHGSSPKIVSRRHRSSIRFILLRFSFESFEIPVKNSAVLLNNGL